MFTPPPFSYSTQVRGIEITGTVLWCYDNDVEVEITSPYADIRAGLHVSAFAMYLPNRNLNKEREISEKGFRTIASCLITAYEEADFLFNNGEILRARIVESERERMQLVAKIEILRAEFPEEKRQQKCEYRQNRLSQTQYTRFLKAYQVEIEALETRISDSYRNIFSGFPRHHVRHGSEKQGIQFVMKHHAK